ncbi:putative lipid II flippase FtsW [Candidatus Uhrbacteria bacterium]|nr:putative lipid II flippase FtsW [Candidatus Uhrbacteria bacterium]
MNVRPRVAFSLDPVIVGLTIALILVGLMILTSATGPIAFQRTGDSLFFVKRQLLTGVLPGLLGFFFLAFIDFRRWKKFAFLALITSIILLVLVYIPGIGEHSHGANGWIHVGSFNFQPSELVKLTFFLYLAGWLEKRQGTEAHQAKTGLLPFLIALGIIMLLLVLQPDTGSMAVIVGTSLLLYFISGAPIIWFGGLCALGAGVLVLLIKFSPYRAARFMTFLHPELDPKGIGYHINQAILAIGSGGLFGLGYGNSRQKFLYLPEVQSDSIVAVMAEEFGFIVMLMFIVVFGILVWRCFKIARASQDRFGMYLAASVGIWIALQTFLNVGSMTGLLPITGVTLPFISQGGSSLTVLLWAMGLVAGIPRAQGSRMPR